MPKQSKRMAARQAALAKKKKGAPKQPPVYRAPAPRPMPAEPEAPIVPGPAVQPVAPGIDGGAVASVLPEFELPQRPSARQTPTRAQMATAQRRVTQRMPYLQTDLRLVGVLGAMLAVTLLVLALILR